jgi:hypothetical protein
MEVNRELHALGRQPPVYEAGWIPEPFWTLYERGKSIFPSRNKPQFLDHPSHNLVAALTEISLLPNLFLRIKLIN